jgi:hypothetical protein
MRILLPWVLACACGHAPPPKPPPPELPVATPADLAGTWVADDEMDRGYRMTIGKDNTFDLVIDRGKVGNCEQKGTLSPGAAPKEFTLQYEKNECNRDYTGAGIQLKVASFTGDTLAVVMVGYGVEERHAFKRAPR